MKPKPSEAENRLKGRCLFDESLPERKELFEFNEYLQKNMFFEEDAEKGCPGKKDYEVYKNLMNINFSEGKLIHLSRWRTFMSKVFKMLK